jgi:hypothetical protein
MLKRIRNPEKNITLYVAELFLELQDVEADGHAVDIPGPRAEAPVLSFL